MKKLVASALTMLSLSIPFTGSAATILKLDLGNSGHELELVGTTLQAIDDGDTSTTGAQDTNINFTSTFDHLPDLVDEQGSLDLSDIHLSGAVATVAGMVVQPTLGGSFRIWDQSNQLLLSADLDLGSIVGPLQDTATGAFTSLNLGHITGGTLAHWLEPHGFALAFALTPVSDGQGFRLTGTTLDPFTAGATADVDAIAVPEPNTGVLLAACVTLGLLSARFHQYGDDANPGSR